MLKDIYKDAETRMHKAVENTRQEFATLRTGRASTALLEGIMVDYYGTQVPLPQVAAIRAPEPRLLAIQPYDKQTLIDIEKAILKSDLGLTPSNDGTVVRLPIPEPTSERRKELVQLAHKLAEDGRIAVRNIRRDANQHTEELKHDKEISEDQTRDAHDEIQKYTDRFVAEIDSLLKAKEREILEE